MAFNGTITFKGVTSSNYALTITTPPSIIHPELFTEEYTIPGKDGTLYGVSPYRGSAQIIVTMALVKKGFTNNVADYITEYRKVRSWLQGTGKLKIGDAPDSYYEVQKVSITGDERTVVQYGTIQVTFVVYPYEFLDSGDTGVAGGTIVNNNDICSPLYKIVGTGSGTLSVNGKSMTYTVNGTLYIDTRRYIAYDGSNTNKSNSIAGDYDDLKLIHGNNSVAATAGTLTVYPKWGYVL